jgi:hypothetical protein
MTLSGDDELREVATLLFERGAQVCSPWGRSRAFACFGAAEVPKVDSKNRSDLRLVEGAEMTVDRPDRNRY